ncbi:MAG TPA: hypothetical protein PKD23_09100 [Bellilinea sp.]|jgi:hypothetical protein|nr:hypothetical protein [Bellilinea sp.]
MDSNSANSLEQIPAGKLRPVYERLKTNFVAHFPTLLSFAILIIVAVMTITLQNKIVGWEPGYDEYQPKHHGWVSSQGLAIIASATPENHFVGYAILEKDENNNPVYDYFDRYPVFFSAIFNQILQLETKLSSKIYLAKQVMNLIFIATLLVAFLLIDKLIKNKPLAITATLFAFSNPFLLFYKDMVHFDQPALFGFLLLIYAIALYRIDGKKFPVYIATLIAVGAGRGYASFATLGLWFIFEAFLIFKVKGPAFGQKVKHLIRHPAFQLCIIAILWAAALLSYNIVIEAHTRNIPLSETSIINSAQRRLSLNEAFNEEYEVVTNWSYFLRTQVDRLIQWTFPVDRVNLGDLGNFILLLGMYAIMWLAIRKFPLEKKLIFLLLMFSAYFWMIPMRSLTAFHDYTTMYYIGIPLTFYTAVVLLLKPSKDAASYLAIMALVLYLGGITQLSYWHYSLAGNTNEYTYDYMRIDAAIEGEWNNIFIQDIVPYGTYAPRFYLGNQYEAPEDISDYVITANENYGPPEDNLTPENNLLYLFKK